MADSSRSKLLCVDAEQQTLDDMRTALEPRYEVLDARNSGEALRLLEQHPDVVAIFSDLQLPGMDGATFLARARELVPNAGRVLLTSSHTNLQSAIAAVNEAHILQFLSKPCQTHELLAAAEAASRHHKQSALESTGIRRALTAQIHSKDQTTGLASRARFIQTLEGVCADADGKNLLHSFAVLIISIENLRDINATDGHATGDLALQVLAQRLRDHCPKAHCIARWGDEEFAVLLPSSFLQERAVLSSAETLSAQLTRPIMLQKSEERVRVCIGIALVPVHTGDAKTAAKFAAIAVRQAREQSCVACLFRSDWAQRLEYRHHLLAALRDAIESDALHLHYQPIIDLKQGMVRAFEALVRWNHPSLGPVSSAQFISLAEESGEMPRLGQWILRRACQEGRRLAGRYCARVSVNISVQQLLQDSFLAQLDDELRIARLHPRELEVELTETVLASDAERSLAVLIELRKRGI